MCPLVCPHDSALVLQLPNAKEVVNSSMESETTTSSSEAFVLPASNGVSDTTLPPTADDQLAVEKVKRAVEPYPQESIKIVPGGIFRRKRNIENENTVIPSINYQMIDDKRVAECCVGHRCECDKTKCKQTHCGPNQYKNLERSGSDKPGDCCPIYSCSDVHNAHYHDDLSCFSKNHKRHFSVNATWNEDDCTQCFCNEYGESKCHISFCKPKSCEKKIQRPGECCPECDFSGTKFCPGHEDCDLHCRQGFQTDPENGCTICRCAKLTTTPTTITTGSNSSADEKKIKETTADESLLTYLPIFFICLSILLFSIVAWLTCRYCSTHKDKHRLNLKHNNNLTPLI